MLWKDGEMHKWAMEGGFTFSWMITRYLHFCILGKLHINPSLELDRAEVSVTEQHKFLGIVFDKWLAFIPHLKCSWVFQLPCVVAHTEWGVN